jgi:hypothetical protein
MAGKCKMEFYFKREDLLNLIKKNPTAKGVIVSQEIVPRKGADGKFSSTVYIRARTTNPKEKAISAKSKSGAVAGPDEIDGCPYPPGCTE